MTKPVDTPAGGTYKVDAFCQNCTWVCLDLPVRIGVPVRQMACKNCSCPELRLASATEVTVAKKYGKTTSG